MGGERMPVVLCVDAEPDDLHPHLGAREPWRGLVGAHRLLSAMRPRLEDATGQPVRFSWFFRMDQQIIDVCGSASWGVDRHPDIIEDILRHGDGLGVHPHPYRWLPRRNTWLFDFGDQGWVEECIRLSLDTFAASLGRPCTTVHLPPWQNNRTVAFLERAGVEVDVSIIPGQRPNRRFDAGGPTRARMRSTFQVPREPYQPSRADFRLPAADGDRSITLLPLSTAPLSLGPHPRAIARFLVALAATGRFQAEGALYPDGVYRYPDDFTRLLGRAVVRRRYLALPIRSDFPVHAEFDARMRAALSALLGHAARSRFVFTTAPEAVRLLGASPAAAPA